MRAGFHTYCGGGFLLLPYLKEMAIEEKVPFLGVKKNGGISSLNLSLSIVFGSIFRIERISEYDDFTDLGIPVLSGLPSLPDQSTLQTFISQITMENSEIFIKEMGKVSKRMGLIKGRAINLDTHYSAYWGKSKIGKDKHPTRNKSLPGIRQILTQDQETTNPIFLTAKYPGGSPVDIAKKMLLITKEIVEEDEDSSPMERAIFDKWFSVGALLDWINREMNIYFVTLLKMHENRLEEAKSLSFQEFKEHAGEKIAQTHIKLKDYQGEVRMIALYILEEDKYICHITNDEKNIEEFLIEEYTNRWRIENWFKENSFLALDKLPGIELNKILALSGLKTSVAYNLVSLFKKNLEGYEKCFIETIYRKFLHQGAYVKAKGREIKVTFYNHPYQNILKPLYQDISAKMEKAGYSPALFWLNGRPIKIDFK